MEKENEPVVDTTEKEEGVVPEVKTESEPKNKKDDKKDVVEIPRSTLEKVMTRLENLEKDNELLKEVADKEKLNKIQNLRSGGKLVKTVNLNMINNMVVLGWSRVKDDVYFDEQGRLHEEQIILVHYEDGKKKEMDYRAFSRIKSPLKAEVLSETKDTDGNHNLKVITPEGKEINIDIKFVN